MKTPTHTREGRDVADLFDQYAGAVYGYLLRLSGDQALADDLTNDFANRDGAHDFLSEWQHGFFDDFYAIRLDFSGSRFNDPNGYGDHPLHWRLELPGVAKFSR